MVGPNIVRIAVTTHRRLRTIWYIQHIVGTLVNSLWQCATNFIFQYLNMTHATGKTSAKNKCFWIKMLRNIPKRVRKVLIRFNELGVHVSHRAVFIPQKYGSRARILLFDVFPNLRGYMAKKRRKKKVSQNKKKNFIRTTTSCALLSVSY